jgi:AcrR family transcriptional regulator
MPRSRRPRWRRRKEDRPAEIIAAALESFAERGFAATRLDDIAVRAGVTRGTLYLYFPSKEELFKAVVRQSIVPILARVEATIADYDGPTADLLANLILSFPDAVLGSRISAIPKLVIAEARTFPEIARFYLDEVVHRGRRAITAAVRRGVARGEFRRVDLDHIFFCVMGPVLLTALWQHSLGLYDTKGLNPRALCRAHVDLLLRGLLDQGAKQ